MLKRNYLLAFLAVCLLAFSSCSKDDSDDNPEFTCEDFDILLVEDGGDLGVELIEGTAPFTYVWSTGETTTSISPAESGTFSVTVTDTENCTTSDEIEFELIVSVPCEDFDILLVENGPDLEIEVIEGSAPFTYVWSTGETTASISPTEFGTFSVTVTDAENCTTSDEIEFESVGTVPCEDIEILLTEDGGDLGVEVIDGIPPFEFEWSTEETTATITPEESGIFSVTITDEFGCTGSAEIEFEFVVVDPCEDFSLFLTVDNGALVTEVLGGTPPFSYSWSTGETTPSITPTDSGEYSITVIDAEGCTISESFVLVLPDELVANIIHDGAGLLTVEVAGGVPPYTYEWSNGANASSITVGDGVYTVTVTDANGNIVIEEITVMLNPNTCDNLLNINAENTNTPLMFSAQSEAYLWKGNCDELDPASAFDHYYLVVDITWDSWGTNNPIGIADIADGIPGVSFGSIGIPQVGDVLSPYLETDDYFYNVSEGANYDLDEVEITITESSNELGGEIAGTISGTIVSQNNVNDSSSVTGSFCVSIVFVCE